MPVEPSVILLRLNGKQQMLLHDAWPDLCLRRQTAMPHHSDCQRKRQDRGERRLVRTGMSNNEVTCAIPQSCIAELIERLRAARAADNAVAAYAAEDSKRFAHQQ
jgi:hypothetical protein